MNDTDRNPIREAEILLAEGDAHAAFRTLRWVFREPDLPAQADRLGQALGVLAPIGRVLAGDAFGDLVGRAADRLDDVQSLYDLGYEFMEQGLFELAVAVLLRAHGLAPHTEAIVTELVAALEEDGRNPVALAILRAEPDLCAESFICRYLLAFNAILSAELDAARQALEGLAPSDDEDERFMARRIERMLVRADALAGVCDLGPRDLRGWHHLSTGGVLLHLSPYGFDEGMNGRYAFTQDSENRCRYILERLAALLAEWNWSPDRILTTSDRDSRILATAAGALLGLDVADFGPGCGPGLVVVYDLGTVAPDTSEEIWHRQEGQLLFAHAACWTEPAICAPDLVGYLYQTQQVAWGERLRVSADGGPVETLAASDEPDAVIAARILAAELDPELSTLDEGEAVTRAFAAMRAGVAQAPLGERRSPLWPGGPVVSSRFA